MKKKRLPTIFKGTNLKFWWNMKERARLRVKRLWQQACDHDGIPYGSSFVIFSDDNPFNRAYDVAMSVYQRIAKSPNYYEG